MRAKIKWHIPKELMIRACNHTLEKHKGYCSDKWGEKEAAECRAYCGSEYEHIETDWIRRAATALRKTGKLASVNGGPKRKKLSEPTGRYAEYLSSDHWKEIREACLLFWDGRCALCKDRASDVHHNTYIRVGDEKLTDVVPLCRSCHKRFHGVMPDGNEVMNADDEGLFRGC